MRVTILGSGGSGGVPLVDGSWGRCDPSNPKNRRRRVSVLVEWRGKTVLIDTSPDCRAQLIDAGVKTLDAVLFTHDHADHTHGIDDLRYMRRDKALSPILAYAETPVLERMAVRFDYIFNQSERGSGLLYKPFMAAAPIAADAPFTICDSLPALAFTQDHGFGSTTTGFRLGNFAYSTDAVDLPEAAFAGLAGLDLWVVDCLRFEPHGTHAHFDKALAWIARVKPKRALLTHLNHTIDYDAALKRCPPGIEPAYDGLTIDLAE